MERVNWNLNLKNRVTAENALKYKNWSIRIGSDKIKTIESFNFLNYLLKLLTESTWDSEQSFIW